MLFTDPSNYHQLSTITIYQPVSLTNHKPDGIQILMFTPMRPFTLPCYA